MQISCQHWVSDIGTGIAYIAEIGDIGTVLAYPRSIGYPQWTIRPPRSTIETHKSHKKNSHADFTEGILFAQGVRLAIDHTTHTLSLTPSEFFFQNSHI